jgi:alpha-1,6-mannosyltransferase
MILLDINTFFAEKAGGIRTFYRAKISFFERQLAHRYYLVYPGGRRAIVSRSPGVTLAEFYGPQVSKFPGGYRWMLDYAGVLALIRKEKPDVIEVGDPWLTGLFCLAIKKLGLYRGLLACFYHSDPILTHLLPWARRGHATVWKRNLILRPLAALFYRLQRSYDLTVVSSRTMQDHLRNHSVEAALAPLGVTDVFLEGAPPARPQKAMAARGGRLLYAGRLNQEKGIKLIQEVLPRLLEQDEISVTVIGRGGAAEDFARLEHPRFRYLGFIEDAAEVRSIYDDHDILLAPGPFESFGMGVLEAMARGMVVVGPDQGATAEILRQAESPFIFRAEDTEDFLRAIMKAIDCDQCAESSRSRDTAMRYGSMEQAMGRLVDLYAARTGRAVAEASP